MRDLTVIYKKNGELVERAADRKEAVEMINEGMDIVSIIYDDEGTDELDNLRKVAACVDDKHTFKVVDAYIECFGIGALSKELLEERYYGYFMTVRDFGYESAHGYINIPDWTECYFDYEAFGEDELIFNYEEHNGYYFRHYV